MFLLREDYSAHGRDWTRPGLRALWFYRLGHWRLSLNSRIARGFLGPICRLLYRFSRNRYGIELPADATIGRRVIFEHQNGIVIHGSAQVGDDSIIRQGVTLGNRYLSRSGEAPVLGKGVNVGAGAKLLGQIYVGDNASIGANAVVLEDVEEGVTVVGIPAQVIRSK